MFFQWFYLDCPLYRGSLCWGRGIKWAVQHRLYFFTCFTWIADCPFYRGILCWGRGIKRPVQHRLCFFRGFTWTVHFIEAFFVGRGGIELPVQHRLCFFQGFYLDCPLYRGILCWGSGTKRPVQHRLCFFQWFSVVLPGVFHWFYPVHFIEAFLPCAHRGHSLLGEGYKVASQSNIDCRFFQGFYLDCPLYRGILCCGRGYQAASPT